MRKKISKPSVWIYIILIASVVVLVWPLFKSGFFQSDDGEWMVIRLSAFYQSLAEGQFPVRFLGRLNHSYGYPVSNFLYPGFLYIGSWLHILNFSFTDSIKIILIGSILGGSISLFFFLRRMFSSFASAFGTCIFTLATYLVFDLYKRGSVGEILAFFPALLCLALLSTRSLTFLPYVFSLLLISHNSLALIFTGLIICYVSYYHLKQAILPLVLGFGIATFFWFPAFNEKRFVSFDLIQVSDPFQYFAVGNHLVLGIIPLIIFVVALLIKLYSLRKDYIFWIYTLSISLVLAFPISYPFWKISLFSRLFQFPYRFLALAIVASAYIFAAVYDNLTPLVRQVFTFTMITISLIFIYQFQSNTLYVNRENGYYTTNEATTTVAYEYMPRWIQKIPQERTPYKIDVYSGDAVIREKTVKTQTIIADIEAKSDSLIEINTIFYPGWGASVDGQPVQILYDNPEGLIRVKIPSGIHRLLLQFRETPSRFIADLVSLISIILAIVFSITRYIHSSKK